MTMAGETALIERMEALVAARRDMPLRVTDQAFTLVGAEAGLMSDETPEVYWTTVDEFAISIYSRAKWYSHQRGPMRYGLAALLHGGGHDLDAYWPFSQRGRAYMRKLGVNCRATEEGTACLYQLFASNGDAENAPPIIERFHDIYRHLRTEYWDTVDVKFYPYAVMAAQNVPEKSLILARWLALNEALKKEKVRPAGERFKAALILTASHEFADRLTHALCSLVKTAKGSGRALRSMTVTDAAFLKASGGDPAKLAETWADTARALRKGALELSSEDAASSAAFIVLYAALKQSPAQRHLLHTKLAADLLRVVHQRRSEKLAGGHWDDHHHDTDGGGDGGD